MISIQRWDFLSRHGEGMKKDSLTSALVLAAGASNRMGTAKQLLPPDDRPLLQHVLNTVRSSEVRDVILVLGHSAQKIQQELDLNGVKVVINEDYEQGMGTSLKAGLAAVDQQIQGAIIMLADQPFVHSTTLNALIALGSSTNAQIVIPTYRGFPGNPVLLDRSVFSEAMAVRGDIGCRAIFGSHVSGIVTLPVGDVGILLDVDQRSDYEKLQTAGRENAFQQRPDLEEKGPGAIDPARPELVIVGRELKALQGKTSPFRCWKQPSDLRRFTERGSNGAVSNHDGWSVLDQPSMRPPIAAMIP